MSRQMREMTTAAIQKIDLNDIKQHLYSTEIYNIKMEKEGIA